MHEARIGDRASVERLYPREDFERDAGENARADAAGPPGPPDRLARQC